VVNGEVSAAQSCANCGTPLSGRFCGACGQRHEPHIHSLREFASEATESLTHADSRVWRTLWPLLVKPGFLTKEFLEGRRARYLPPFRLYLVLSVVFFVIAQVGNGEDFTQAYTQDFAASARKSESAAQSPAETPQQRADRMCRDATWELSGKSYIEPRLREGCRKIVMDGGRGLLQAIYYNTPRGLIILLPLLALTMRLMYLRRYYVEHLLFFVHTHAFAFVFLTVYVLAVQLIPFDWFTGLATTAMVFLIPYYTYRAMLRVYAQGKWLTRLKFWLLAVAYVALGSIMAVMLSFYTMVTL
jgi:hypothetical protein